MSDQYDRQVSEYWNKERAEAAEFYKDTPMTAASMPEANSPEAPEGSTAPTKPDPAPDAVALLNAALAKAFPGDQMTAVKAQRVVLPLLSQLATTTSPATGGEALAALLAGLFGWEDRSVTHAIMHAENAVLNLRADLAAAKAELEEERKVSAEEAQKAGRGFIIRELAAAALGVAPDHDPVVAALRKWIADKQRVPATREDVAACLRQVQALAGEAIARATQERDALVQRLRQGPHRFVHRAMFDQVRAERDHVLADWNSLVSAIGARSHGTAVAGAKVLVADRERLRAAVEQALVALSVEAAEYVPAMADAIGILQAAAQGIPTAAPGGKAWLLLDIPKGKGNSFCSWWRPDSKGYCWSVDAAGRYTEEEARDTAARSQGEVFAVRESDAVRLAYRVVEQSRDNLAALTAPAAPAQGGEVGR